MKRESEYLLILCGVFDDSYTPLTRAEFWKYYHNYGDSVTGIVESHEGRIDKLLERSGSVTFAIETMSEMGIRITTFLEDSFPGMVYNRLGDFCPPLMYMAGEERLLMHRYAGYVGSRIIEEDDIKWTKMMVQKNISDGFGIVSGGAKGVDSISIGHALNEGGTAIAFLPDNIKTWIQDRYYREQIMNGRLLIYSHVSPFARKTRTSFVASAMERNKLIYAQSVATAVVRSDLNKGGTWAGATEAIKHRWTPVFVWDNKSYAGNQRLIELGGIPIDDDGKKVEKKTDIPDDEKNVEPVQLSLFDNMFAGSVR